MWVEETHYLLFDGGQDVVGGVVSLHVAASWTVADGQQKPLLRHWALLRSWHSSCWDTRTHIYTHTHNALVTTGARLKVLHTYRTGCVRVRTHAGKAMLRSGGAPHQQCTNIHPHMPYGPNKKRTVNVLCLWQCKWMPYGLETTHDLNNDLCMKFSHIKIQHKQKESQRFWWGQKMECKFQS